jgi:hypothetical protein
MRNSTAKNSAGTTAPLREDKGEKATLQKVWPKKFDLIFLGGILRCVFTADPN